MKRKKFSILILFLILTVVFVSAAFVACNNTTEEDTAEALEPTEGLLISNSDFKVIGTSGSYPHTITDWTGGKLYSSSSVPGDVIAGAISLEEALYAADRALWNDDGSADESGKTLYERLVAGGHFSDAEDAVNNILMIHMPTSDMAEDDDDDYGPTAYGYSSKSFSLDAGSYYKLSVDVLTYDIAGTDDEDNVPGARIYLSSAGYAEISGIDTKGEWKEYTIYIESAATSSTSLTLNLGLGKYSSYYRDGLTSGYAFFDNVTLEKINDGEVTEAEAEAVFTEKVNEERMAYETILADYRNETATADDETDVTPLAVRYAAMTTRTMTLKASNGRFDFGSTTIGTSAPSGWSLVTGEDAPTSYRFNGVISASLFGDNYTSYAGTYYIDRTPSTPATNLVNVTGYMDSHLDGSMGDSVYMLSQQMMTAQGIRSSRKLVIEKNGLYALSVSVLTYNVYGGGVSLILSGDGEDIVIEGISENPYDGTVLFGEERRATPPTTTAGAPTPSTSAATSIRTCPTTSLCGWARATPRTTSRKNTPTTPLPPLPLRAAPAPPTAPTAVSLRAGRSLTTWISSNARRKISTKPSKASLPPTSWMWRAATRPSFTPNSPPRAISRPHPNFTATFPAISLTAAVTTTPQAPSARPRAGATSPPTRTLLPSSTRTS